MENHNNICFTDIGFGILCRYTSIFDYSISKYEDTFLSRAAIVRFSLYKKQGFRSMQKPCNWRTGWDSNPRAREDYLISSQGRYDHFDTCPYINFLPTFRQTSSNSLSELDNVNIISNSFKIVNRLIVNNSLNAHLPALFIQNNISP